MTTNYSAGYAAGSNMRTHNPHPQGTAAHKEWQQGNDAAMYGDEASMTGEQPVLKLSGRMVEIKPESSLHFNPRS